MGTRYKFLVVVLFIIYASTVISNDCDMQGVDHWHFWQDVSIEDVFEGIVASRTTENITGIQSVSQTLTNHGPYMDVSISESLFIIRTNEAFQSYEEYETSQQISIATTFNCIGGSTRSLTFMITVIDTNNNDPIFRPDDVYEFTVIPPLPPGFQITNNVNQITVRDIDLTTQRIDFEILDNSNFFIGYDASSTTPKEFLASLTTTTLMRNIPEPIEFIISATDVDLTGDPRRTRNATIRIQSDGSFELPEELVFSQTFYLADYTEENEITLQESITLKQGYHEQVKFSLVSGENSEYFDIVPNGNDVTLLIVKPLPVDILALRQIFIIVRADREFTSGTSATVVVQLPEVVNLRFEKPIYEGFIIDNTLELSNLILSQGYENQIISVDIQSEYASNFDYNIAENQISIIMSPLSNDIINQNTFLNLKVVASTNLRSASTVITLEIVKDDLTTPSFEKPLYIGTYDVVEGLILEEIVLIQGFDDSVQLSLQGVHRDLFQMTPPGPNIKLTVSSIPVELFKEQHILLTIEATKPRTVGATTAISISLPPEILLEFENQNYNGKIIDNVLELDDLVLSQGYETENIIVNIEHEYSSSFNYRIIGNSITLLMSSLEADVIRDNTFLNLLVFASTNRSSASTVVTLEIIKNDKTTPIFQHSLFSGSYDPVEGLKMTEIVISQGYDDTVDVLLDGDHTDYFWLNQTGPNINLELEVSSLPPQLYSEGHIFLTIIATKPRTVGANAAVVITLPSATELEFLQDTNIGTIRENELNIDTIILSVYADDVELTLTGEYENHFKVTRVDSQITLDMIEKLPETTLLQNDFIVLSLSASATNAVNARTTILLNIVKEDAFTPVFNEKIYTVDYLTPSSLNVPSIFLTQGYDDTVSFRITGTHSEYFTINPNGNKVELTIQKTIPEELIFKEKVFVFNIIAEKPLTVDARAAISMNFPIELTEPTALAFSKTFYTGSLEQSNLKIENIELSVGFTTSTEFRINGAYKDYFEVQNEGNILTVFQTNNLPSEVLNFEFIALELQAQRERAISVSATIIIDIVQPEPVTPPVFSAPFYRAVYTEEKGLQFETDIVLSQGFDDTVTFELEGVYRDWFYVTNNDDLVLISVKEIPADVLESNQHLVFSIDAIKTGAINGIATIVIDLPQDTSAGQILGFEQNNYLGSIEGNNIKLPAIVLNEGFTSNVQFSLLGDLQPFFSVTNDLATVTITLGNSIPDDLIPSNRLVILQLQATAPSALPAFTTIILEIINEDDDSPTAVDLVFDQTYYVGSYTAADGLQFDGLISLTEGYDENVQFYLEGESAQWFDLERVGESARLVLRSPIPSAVLANNQQLLFVIRADRHAISARATIVILLTDDTSAGQILGFEQNNYLGSIEGNNIKLPAIVLNEGFTSNVQFSLLGDLQPFFSVTNDLTTVMITLENSIPKDLIPSNRLVILQLQATAPSALPAFTTIILEVVNEEDVQEDLVRFDRVLYEGRIQGGIVQHEIINLSGFEQDKVDIIGSFSTLFSARHNNGVVIVETVGSLTLPADLRHVVLELRADNAAAVLTLEITDSDLPKEPNVIFSSESYVIQVEKGQTGTVGQVEAIADNGESVTYSLRLDNEHLLSRLSITNDGELRLSAPADIGSYNFQVVATTVFTGTNGVTTVYLSVHETTPCVNDVGVPPLVVIDRDEEEPHRDLVTIDTVQHAGCHYRLENNWPTDQQWLYVDETGLHAHAIDREHPSIAFMALSQIKVELTLHCNTETRNKRSTRQNWLGSYDYGINTWLLGNTIEYNRKTTIVNLIVNDINDNAPIFIGKENEPIAVGYPVLDLISTISPRSLIELKATDADIGENAALMYWSSESQLAVSSSTGFVHVRNDAQLTQDMQLIVSATDLNGQGLTGTISLIVKLLDINNIAVLTVQNAFLEDESTILSNLSSAVGYDVKALKSVVVSNSEEQAINTHNREKRDVGSNGHLLQIHVYGLMQREPVLVENLSADINENAEVIPVTITRIASLEEHLQESYNFSGRNVGLLVSTIVLSVLLFLVIVAAVVVWFIFLRRKLQNYEQFSETNSLSSKTEPTVSEMKPDTGDTLPRLNIEELKRSERRLQDMLNAPIENIVVEPTTSANNTTIIPINPVDNKAPIIIQDKLKDGESSDEDEFGERKKGRRKSVVTFNENVEKIIHVEDNPEESLKDDDNEKFEIYKL